MPHTDWWARAATGASVFIWMICGRVKFESWWSLLFRRKPKQHNTGMLRWIVKCFRVYTTTAVIVSALPDEASGLAWWAGWDQSKYRGGEWPSQRNSLDQCGAAILASQPLETIAPQTTGLKPANHTGKLISSDLPAQTCRLHDVAHQSLCHSHSCSRGIWSRGQTANQSVLDFSLF